MKPQGKKSFRSLARLSIAALGVLSTLQGVQASEYQVDQKVFQGGHCQALYGSQESRLTHNIDWLSNSSNHYTYVNCPLTRDSVQVSTRDPRARVRVYRPSGTGALDCTFYGRAVNGTSWIVHDSAPVGWSYVDMTLPGTSPGASYAVRCHLPGGARIQKVVLDE